MNDLAAPRRTDETLEIVRTSSRLKDIRPAWQGLWQRSGARIFQSPDWVAGWWNTLSDQSTRRLCIVLAWRGEELVGVMPLATRRGWGLRILEWAAYAYSDYCDVLVEPGAPPSLIQRMWAKAKADGGFDIAMLARLLPDAAARALMPEQASSFGQDSRGFRQDHRKDMSLRVTGTFENGEAWFNTFPKKVRQNYRRSVSVLNEAAPTTFRLMGLDEPHAPVLARMAEFKRATLARKGIEAPLFEAGSSTLETLVGTLAASGQLRLFVLEQAGEVIAVSVNFQQDKTLMAFVTSYDPAIEKGSPGYVLMIDYIRWAFDNGLNVVDFLCGSEAFKGRLASTTVTLDSFIAPGSLLGPAVIVLDRLRHRWRSRRLREVEAAGMLHVGLALPLTQCLLHTHI